MRIVVAFHLLGVVLWMGGLLAVSRILAFHAQEPPPVRPRFSFLERRLDSFVAMPGAVLTIATGLAQIQFEPAGYFRYALWLHVKLVLVACILAVHVVLTRRHRSLALQPADQPIGRALFSASHGLIGLLLIAVLLLAVLKPMARG